MKHLTQFVIVFWFLFVVGASSASAADKVPVLLGGLVIGTNALDLAVTQMALNTGQAYETNPLLAGSGARRYAIKSGITGFETWAVWYAWRHREKKAAIACALVIASINVAVSANNYRVMREIRRRQRAQ